MLTNLSSTSSVLPLPAPSAQSLDPSVPNVEVGAAAPLKFDTLGPMVVNSDGTLSRIANWEDMTEAERERTMRVIATRNKARLAKQQKPSDDGDASSRAVPLSSANESKE